MTTDRIEFYENDLSNLILSIRSSHAPNRDEFVNIRKVTYRVIGRTYSADYTESSLPEMVCVINLEKVEA